MTNEEKIVSDIYTKYHNFYDGDVQGTCSVIADDIVNAIGGVAIAGFIDYRTSERSHWWVEKDGKIFDPMTDDKFYPNKYTRKEVHRDQAILKRVLKHYEHYRVS